MRIYEIKDKQNRVFAFEIENILIGRRGVCRLVKTIPNVRFIRGLKGHLWWADDTFCIFEVRGQIFHAWESWGDSSRYWIGPEPPKWCEQIEEVKMVFSKYNPIKDLLSINNWLNLP